MKTALASLLALLLAACGGGSTTTAPTPTPVVQPKIVAFLGDSVVAGYQGNPSPTANQIASGVFFLYLPDQSYPSLIQKASGGAIKSINYGIGGQDTAQVYATQYPLAIVAKPDIMVISTGINDARLGLPLQNYVQLYSIMLADLKAKHIKSIVVTPTHWSMPLDAEIDKYAEAMKQIASQYGAIVVDARSTETSDWICSPHDFHPCALGYQEIAKLVWPAIVGG